MKNWKSILLVNSMVCISCMALPAAYAGGGCHPGPYIVKDKDEIARENEAKALKQECRDATTNKADAMKLFKSIMKERRSVKTFG